MRVPEISLVNELQAQNKHDLYRYHKYKREYQQTQYLTACTVSFMVVPSVRAWGFSFFICVFRLQIRLCFSFGIVTNFLFLKTGSIFIPVSVRFMPTV